MSWEAPPRASFTRLREPALHLLVTRARETQAAGGIRRNRRVRTPRDTRSLSPGWHRRLGDIMQSDGWVESAVAHKRKHPILLIRRFDVDFTRAAVATPRTSGRRGWR